MNSSLLTFQNPVDDSHGIRDSDFLVTIHVGSTEHEVARRIAVGENVVHHVMQIIARAIYPYSEYRTVKYLSDNTALAEMFHIPKERLTKDALYKSALRLWDVHRRMEDWLHERVMSMFLVTTRMETVKGETIEIRQATEEEQELARIYSLLDITPHPMGTRKFVGPPKIPPEKNHR